MSGKRIGYNDEVSMGTGQDAKAASNLNSTASERFQTGTNSTARYTNNKKPKGPFGARGLPK